MKIFSVFLVWSKTKRTIFIIINDEIQRNSCLSNAGINKQTMRLRTKQLQLNWHIEIKEEEKKIQKHNNYFNKTGVYSFGSEWRQRAVFIQRMNNLQLTMKWKLKQVKSVWRSTILINFIDTERQPRSSCCAEEGNWAEPNRAKSECNLYQRVILQEGRQNLLSTSFVFLIKIYKNFYFYEFCLRTFWRVSLFSIIFFFRFSFDYYYALKCLTLFHFFFYRNKRNFRVLITNDRIVSSVATTQYLLCLNAKWFWNIDNSICLNLYIFCFTFFPLRTERKVRYIWRERGKYERQLPFTFRSRTPSQK